MILKAWSVQVQFQTIQFIVIKNCSWNPACFPEIAFQFSNSFEKRNRASISLIILITVDEVILFDPIFGVSLLHVLSDTIFDVATAERSKAPDWELWSKVVDSNPSRPCEQFFDPVLQKSTRHPQSG